MSLELLDANDEPLLLDASARACIGEADNEGSLTNDAHGYDGCAAFYVLPFVRSQFLKCLFREL